MSFLIVIGSIIVGWIVPEFFIALSPNNVRAPVAQNVAMAIGAGLICAGIVFQ